ncbi:hypothetical protein WJ92_02935 [Burkholderia ubonensis]|nr:hypothetical protein WJ92_02935 [Burkholderia ubonensis]
MFREARRPVVWSASKTGAPAVPSKLGDEKRLIAILRPADYDGWLHTRNVDVARVILQLYPANKMVAEAAVEK